MCSIPKFPNFILSVDLKKTTSNDNPSEQLIQSRFSTTVTFIFCRPLTMEASSDHDPIILTQMELPHGVSLPFLRDLHFLGGPDQHGSYQGEIRWKSTSFVTIFDGNILWQGIDLSLFIEGFGEFLQ